MFPWVQVKETENNVLSADIVPLFTIHSQFFNVQLFVEKET